MSQDTESYIIKSHRNVQKEEFKGKKKRQIKIDLGFFNDCTCCLQTHIKIMDYLQNLNLPIFSSEQPDDTSYYSSMNMYQFGIFDILNEKDSSMYPKYLVDAKEAW